MPAAAKPSDEEILRQHVEQKLEMLSRQEQAVGSGGHSIFLGSIATTLRDRQSKNQPVEPMPILKAVGEITRWRASVEHAKTDMEAARTLIHFQDDDEATVKRLDAIGHQLGNLDFHLGQLLGGLDKFRSRPPAIPLVRLSKSRVALHEEAQLRNDMGDAISTLDRVHHDVNQLIGQHAIDIFTQQAAKRGVALKNLREDAEVAYEHPVLLYLDNACKILQTHIMERLDMHVLGIYMRVVEEQAKLEIQQHKRSGLPNL